ncbi:hypothetical protein CLV58_12016 [Spirosoma oryzae]|uniref:Uncharacterized protein n=1 Tax=Spirosoma oryzae TaxID=1469603 RepID=A0A2T0SH79_9BACT|nr:tetratricopeptide repeat protein [Spirosoma oryzae]PRY32765.1 hypothetical protein CLV58_12016 [Spirosoma oryzae]
MNVRRNRGHWSLILALLPLVVAAQPRQLMSSARPVTAHVASHTSTTLDNTRSESIDIETLSIMPLFGERPKTAEQIDREIHFLNDCDQNFTSRTEASEFFAARGWDYISDGQLDTAAHRFNLAWLLNDRNADAYWGLGVVSYQKENLPEAVRLLRKGIDAAGTNVELMGDLATVEIKQFQKDHHRPTLDDAEQQLQRIVTQDPAHAASFQKLSLVSYLKADYDKAWDYFHQARQLDMSILDLSFLSDLIAKRPDPKGVFK